MKSSLMVDDDKSRSCHKGSRLQEEDAAARYLPSEIMDLDANVLVFQRVLLTPTMMRLPAQCSDT